jgi:predicted negative regulator of RcsB-dependent stress response
VDEFLNERDQWERVLKWLREQGPWALVSVAVVAAGYSGWHYWRARVEQRYVSAASRYEAILEAFARSDFDAGLAQADGLVRDFPSSVYADQANLAAARVQVDHNALDKAASRLSDVLGGTRDPELALIARLRLARVQLAQNKPDAALATLNAVNPGAFAARFAQVRGDAFLAKGDRESALKEYRTARASADQTVDTGLLDLKIGELAHS